MESLGSLHIGVKQEGGIRMRSHGSRGWRGGREPAANTDRRQPLEAGKASKVFSPGASRKNKALPTPRF